MDVFALDDHLLAQYTGFARSFTRIRSAELQQEVNRLYAGRRFWPEPLLQLNPHYEGGGSIRSLVGERGLVEDCARIFIDRRAASDAADKSLKLHRHQAQALGLALDAKSFVVTTGTGSGKSLCFFIPIIDSVIKAKRKGESARTRAVVVYPMNALANSQLEELKKFLAGPGHPVSVTFARYTGQEKPEERERIKNNPPDILLTNFMMLELLMTRQSELDKAVIENCRGLKFIVLDELHTYRGRQGADVAMLMRRLRARVGDPNHPPICIGTSATMASEGIEDDRNQIVAGVASRLFGTVIARDAIVTETLKRATNPERSADEGLTELGTSVRRAAEETPYDGRSNEEIASDALAIWVETRLGLKEVNRKPLRASPKSLKEAAALRPDRSRSPRDTLPRRAAVGHQPHQAADPPGAEPDRSAADRRPACQESPTSRVAHARRVSSARPPRFLRERAGIHGRLRPQGIPDRPVAEPNRESLRRQQFDPRQLPCARQFRDQ